VRKLLCHTSGLPLDLPRGAVSYAPGLSWQRLANACLRAPLEQPPDTRVQYSNLGYGLLAIVVERVTGQNFSEAMRAEVLAPLGLDGGLGDELRRRPAVLADVRGRHRGTELEPYNSAFWRDLRLPWGGLITTAEGALRLVRAFGEAAILPMEVAQEATRDQTGGLAGGFAPPLIWPAAPWGLGPELRGTKTPHWAPAEASPTSFGHAGQSGAFAWSDPVAGVSWAILGARTADNGWLLRRAPALGALLMELQA
jgi:beta-lactamase class C